MDQLSDVSQKNGPLKYVIAVDHGTSGVKVGLFSIFGKFIDWESEKSSLILSEGGGAEQDPQEWWNGFLTATKRILAKKLVPTEDIIAVCVSSQWSCTVPVDAQGNHLYNAISWMDTRGQPYIKKKLSGFPNVSGYGLFKILKMVTPTGGGPGLAGKDPTAHILWLKHEHPDIYQKTYKFLEAVDFMNMKLTGKFLATFTSIHIHWVTNAKDLKHIYYDPMLLKFYGIEREKLPDLIRSIDIVGELKSDVAKELGLSSTIKVIGGAPDLQMAAIGSGAVNDYEGHIYIGTSSFFICHVPFKKTDIFNNIASVPSANPDKYFIPAEQETAGACLTFLRDNILYYHSKESKPQNYSDLDEIAIKIPAGSHGLIFTPWLYGERAPVEDHTIRGGIHNLSLQINLDDIVRSVFEGIAYNSRWVMGYVEKFIKRKFKYLNIIGGGANSDVWCQIYADVLNCPIRRVKNPVQANARGATFIAAIALGFIKFNDISKVTEISKVFNPNPANRAIYDKLYAEYVQLYKATSPIYRRLNH
jgi:xylulokinase